MRITLQAKTILGPIALSCPSVVVMLSPFFKLHEIVLLIYMSFESHIFEEFEEGMVRF